MRLVMYTEAFSGQLLPFNIHIRKSKTGRNIFILDRKMGSVLPVEYTNNLPVLDHNISQIKIAMGEHIGLALR